VKFIPARCIIGKKFPAQGVILGMIFIPYIGANSEVIYGKQKRPKERLWVFSMP
jgi:hypothetical protein